MDTQSLSEALCCSLVFYRATETNEGVGFILILQGKPSLITLKGGVDFFLGGWG